MRRIICLLFISVFCHTFYSQQIYCNFEDAKVIVFKTWTGQLDTMAANPDTTGIDTTRFCGKYIRNSEPYDNIKIITYHRLLDVNAYASDATNSPKIKMKIYTTMPPGSRIQLQLGSQEDDDYPSGIHSEFWATTKSMKKWEELVFTFSQIPPGSAVELTDIDKVILMFRPGEFSQDVIYFDDLKGPQLKSIGMEELADGNISFVTNYPNPSVDGSVINFRISSSENVSLKLYDLFGREISSLLDKDLRSGEYSVEVNTGELEGGIYFYTLMVGRESRSYKMVVAR